jgi:hypothetical protein
MYLCLRSRCDPGGPAELTLTGMYNVLEKLRALDRPAGARVGGSGRSPGFSRKPAAGFSPRPRLGG